MQKVCHGNLLRRPEQGRHLLFDPALTRITAWLTSLPAFQISTSRPTDHLHCYDHSRVCSSTGALETGESPQSRRRCLYRSNPHVAGTSSCGTQRDSQRGFHSRKQGTYIHAESPNGMSVCTCVATCCDMRSCQSSWVAVSSSLPSETSVTLSHMRLRSIRAPPQKGREKILVDLGGDKD
jgi:hypothetical protein